jgi:carotenoid cleavage dioxygenase-like enzyme
MLSFGSFIVSTSRHRQHFGTDLMSADRYLTGNFAPVAEEVTTTSLRVTGNIPPELNGRYLRNGPNPLAVEDAQRHHWFMGHGMVHGVCLAHGRAQWYRNRWVRSAELVEALGEDMAGRTLAVSNNTHVIGLADRTWALVEAGSPPVELTAELDTLGVNAFFSTLVDGGFSAHPKVDPDTGDLHAMCYSWAVWGDHLQYVHVGVDGKVRRTVDIPVPGAPMVHDMSLTANYAVVYDLPVTVDLEMVMAGAPFPFAWNDDYQSRVGLLPRTGGASDIIWCEAPSCYVFHPMNAYEDSDGCVVIDLCRYSRMFDRDRNGPFGDSVATLDRWTIDPRARRVSETRIDDRGQEFPRCHPALSSKPYRFGYSVAVTDGGFPRIFKHDLKAGASVAFELGAGRHAGEPYFVPRTGAAAEDDGYLMCFVFDASTERSELVILDARDHAAPPLARIHLPARVPYGFHGSWIADGVAGPSV